MVSNSPVLSAVHALFEALDAPECTSITEYGDCYGNDYGHTMIGVHPVFPLTETFAPNENSYTRQSALRGGRVTVPCYTESGDIAVLETTFHKGDTTIQWVTFPNTPVSVAKALYALLSEAEVRD